MKRTPVTRVVTLEDFKDDDTPIHAIYMGKSKMLVKGGAYYINSTTCASSVSVVQKFNPKLPKVSCGRYAMGQFVINESDSYAKKDAISDEMIQKLTNKAIDLSNIDDSINGKRMDILQDALNELIVALKVSSRYNSIDSTEQKEIALLRTKFVTVVNYIYKRIIHDERVGSSVHSSNVILYTDKELQIYKDCTEQVKKCMIDLFNKYHN